MQTENNLSLWQLTNEHQQLLSQLYDYETGEINEIVQAKLNQLEPNIENKCLSVAKWIRKLESEEKQLDDMIDEINRRKDSYAKEVEKHYKYLQSSMETSGISEISCPYFTVRVKRNPFSTDVTNQELIPDKYIKVTEVKKVNVSVDKNLLKEDVLKTGKQIPGAYVSQKSKLEILITKI